MSTTLKWQPAKPKDGGALPHELKLALRQYFGCTFVDYRTLDVGDKPFLVGLSIGGVAGAADLLKLLDTHIEIVVNEESG